MPLLHQDKTIVGPADSIELTLAIAKVIFDNTMQLKIDNKDFLLDEKGVLKYKFKAQSRPGKYSLPISFDYDDEDGIRKQISKTISYIVK